MTTVKMFCELSAGDMFFLNKDLTLYQKLDEYEAKPLNNLFQDYDDEPIYVGKYVRCIEFSLSCI